MSLILLLLFACCLESAICQPYFYSLEHAEFHFDRFIEDFNRNYNHEIERQQRFEIFKKNLEIVNRYNERSKHAIYGNAILSYFNDFSLFYFNQHERFYEETGHVALYKVDGPVFTEWSFIYRHLGITQFMDFTPEEVNRIFASFKSVSEEDHLCPKILTDADIHGNDAPESFDWRDHDVVTPVDNQLKCGSCYAFSSTGNIEGQYAIKHKKRLSLSEQQIVDCDHRNGGCNGGNMAKVFKTLIEQGGIETDKDYPYKGVDGECKFDASKIAVKVTDCRNYNLTSQEKLKQLLYQNGPLAIGIKGMAVMFYRGGIISDEECNFGDQNHAVLLVGYGVDAEKNEPYWLAKNSWGVTHGEQGYFRMHRGGGPGGACGMLNEDMASAEVA